MADRIGPLYLGLSGLKLKNSPADHRDPNSTNLATIQGSSALPYTCN